MTTRNNKLLFWMGGLAAASAIAMIAILFQLIQGISNGANQLDDTKTRQAVNATLVALLEQTSGMVADNARWDDAVDNTYGQPDPQWLYDTWGYSTADQTYDTTFLIDENGGTAAAFSDGQVLKSNAAEFLGPALQKLIAKLPADAKTFETAAAIQPTAKGLAVVAIAPILPSTGGKSIPGVKPRFLVFSKTLTPGYVASLGERLIVKDLAVVRALEGQVSHVALTDVEGTEVGHLIWSPDRPGDVARAAVEGPAFVVLGGMLACMTVFIFMSSRLSLRLQRSERNAWIMAHSDILTSLPNRQAVIDTLAAKIRDQNSGKSRGLTVMLADLDGFKQVNDAYGHHVGDDLIRAIAAGLQVIAEKFNATLSRLGGDEFAIVLDGDDAQLRTSRITESALGFLLEPFNLGGRIARVGMSIGIAATGSEEIEGPELMRRADVAMYYAKENGKNRSYVYEPRLDAERNSRIAMARHLTVALDNEQIEVAYQPVVDATSRMIISVEALARWQQPGGLRIAPDEFIKVAEEFGLIDRLGNQVLAKACRQAAHWPGIGLSVNISPAQFRNPEFVNRLVAIVDQSGLARNRLELEVTEGYLIEHQEQAKPILEKFRAEGIHVALDDFGTGYSSIGYLRQYHFDRLKIDKSLIRGMISDAPARSIIQATAVLAQSMGMAVTAEGVEGEAEASLLRLAGCNSLQGYHLGRPQSAEAITALLAGPQEQRASA